MNFLLYVYIFLFLRNMVDSSLGVHITPLELLSHHVYFSGLSKWFLASFVIRGLVVGRPYFSELPLGKELARVLAEVKFDTIFVNHL